MVWKLGKLLIYISSSALIRGKRYIRSIFLYFSLWLLHLLIPTIIILHREFLCLSSSSPISLYSSLRNIFFLSPIWEYFFLLIGISIAFHRMHRVSILWYTLKWCLSYPHKITMTFSLSSLCPPSVSLPTSSLPLLFCLFVCLPVCPSAFCLSVCLSAFFLSVCLFVCLSAFCLFVCVYVCLFIYLLVCLSVCLSVCPLSVCLSVYLFIYLFVCLSAVCLSVCLPAYLSVFLFCRYWRRARSGPKARP